jgi:hypothetical protein
MFLQISEGRTGRGRQIPRFDCDPGRWYSQVDIDCKLCLVIFARRTSTTWPIISLSPTSPLAVRPHIGAFVPGDPREAEIVTGLRVAPRPSPHPSARNASGRPHRCVTATASRDRRDWILHTRRHNESVGSSLPEGKLSVSSLGATALFPARQPRAN